MRMTLGAPLLRWAVVIAELEPAIGHEQGGQRRVVVVSNELFHRAERVTVCPITAAADRGSYPNEVAILAGEAGQTKDGVVLCHQVRTISTGRLVRDIGGRPKILGYVEPATRAAVRKALAHHLWLDRPD